MIYNDLFKWLAVKKQKLSVTKVKMAMSENRLLLSILWLIIPEP